MKRLTEWVGEGDERYAIPSPHIRLNGHQRCCNRLAKYEDLGISPEQVRMIDAEYTSLATEYGKCKKDTESGLLIRIPCRAGDVLYAADFYENCIIQAVVKKVTWENGMSDGRHCIRGRIIAAYENDLADIGWAFDDIGTHWFLTKQEAENNLRAGRFFQDREDSFLILQLKESSETVYRRFMNFSWLEKHGEKPEAGHYHAVYSGHLLPVTNLEDLYYQFNQEKPKGFTGHSMSVSDIVVLKQSGVVTYYYVDSIGFKKLDNFHLDNAKGKRI